MIFSGIFQLRGKDMSDFNKIMAFQQMMPYLNKEQQDNLATTLGMELQEIERRLVGKNKEDESCVYSKYGILNMFSWNIYWIFLFG